MSLTSSSVKPIYGDKRPAYNMVYSSKLLSADCVFSFFIGKIPVRNASSIYFVGSLPLNIPRMKLIYSSWTEEFAASSRIKTSHSSIIITNLLFVILLITDRAPYNVFWSLKSISLYRSANSDITFLFIYPDILSGAPASISIHCISRWITSYLLRYFSKSSVCAML